MSNNCKVLLLCNYYSVTTTL